MEKFSDFTQFYENVSEGDLIKIIFKQEVYIDRKNFIIKERDGEFPLNSLAGQYRGVEYSGVEDISKHILAVGFGDSKYLIIFIPNFRNLVKSYEVYR